VSDEEALMHREALQFFHAALQRIPHRRVVVEIGARNINGSLRSLFTQTPPQTYVGIDLVPGPCVDVVANGATYTPASVPDAVLCAEVLEHTEHAQAICDNAWTMLGPDGVFVVSAAAPDRPPHSAKDGGPIDDGEFYRNVDPAVLRQWLRRFETVEVEHHPDRGDVYAVAWKRDVTGPT